MTTEHRPSLSLILAHVPDLIPHVQDPTVTEIMVNPGCVAYVERGGKIERIETPRLTPDGIQTAIQNIAWTYGLDVSIQQPLLEARLDDGSRVAAVMSPISKGGHALTIRKFPWALTLADLQRSGTILPDDIALVQDALSSGGAVIISGGTNTGKTTLLSALASLIPSTDRILVIEDTPEIALECSGVVYLRTRAKDARQPDAHVVTMSELVRAAMRHRPDRIIVGEVRGAEAWSLLQSMNTGHGGTLCTIHAASADDAVDKFAAYVLESGIGLPYPQIVASIRKSVALVLHMRKTGARRSVVERLSLSRTSQPSASAVSLQP